MCDEEAVRRIVREELKAALGTLVVRAETLYGMAEFESAIGEAYRAVSNAAGDMALLLDHTTACETRTTVGAWSECNCRKPEPVALVSTCTCEHSSDMHGEVGCVALIGRAYCRCTSPVGGEL